MNNIQFVCDSTAAFTAQEIKDMSLEVVPLSIHFNNEVFDEGLPDTYDAFYERLAASETLPSTSQPSIGRFQEVFEKALSNGKDVITIVLAASLSGTYNSAAVAAQQVDPDRITVIDSNTAAHNVKYLVKTAWAMANSGSTPAQIKAVVEKQSQTMGAMLTVGDLIYLKRGGRLNNSQFFVGKLLNILPILILRGGKLSPHSKVKGIKAMFAALQQTAPADAKGLTVLHIKNPDGAKQLVKLLNERFPNLNIEIEPISPVIGSHVGPGTLGYTFYS